MDNDNTIPHLGLHLVLAGSVHPLEADLSVHDALVHLWVILIEPGDNVGAADL